MNTGIQDAANAAWKVALAACGDVASAPTLLQTYQEERHPPGADAVKFSGGQYPQAYGDLLQLVQQELLCCFAEDCVNAERWLWPDAG